jgi:hypothetical protein
LIVEHGARRVEGVPPLVSTGAMMMCSMGTTPASLTALPMGSPVQAGTQAATIQAFAPMVNIPTFGMCISPANPQVAIATAAAMGVLTPQPCIPVTTSPWVPGAAITKINNQPALHSACQAMCTWTGVITISSPGGNTKVQVN